MSAISRKWFLSAASAAPLRVDRMHQMRRRRDFVVLAGALLTAPLTSFAQQQPRIRRIGFLTQGHMDLIDSDRIYGPFTQGMREVGYVEGKSIFIEWRSAEGKSARLPDLAAELVRLKVDILLTAGTPAARAAQKATSAIPIVMINIGDPVGSRLVQSLARPGGNSTGLSLMNTELGPKMLELLRGVVPEVTNVAVLVNPSNAAITALLKNVQAAAQNFGVRIQPIEAGTPEEIASGFSDMTRHQAGALITPQDAFFIQQKDQIVDLATKQRLPSMGGHSEYVESGGLMSYGPNLRINFRRAGIYVDKIFKGANPGDLPVEQPTIFDLAINVKTAKALGCKIPPWVLLQATKVIE